MSLSLSSSSAAFNETVAAPSSAPTQVDIRVGDVLLDRYRIDAFLSEGMMGRVYAGVDTGVSREVAIKFLSLAGVERETFERRFLREAAVCAQLVHPNVVTVLDYGETRSGELFIVMEHLAGQTLEDCIDARPLLSLRRIIDIAIQMARGLRAAHRRGIVHRDLKSSNVMILRDTLEDADFVKIFDFGLAKRQPNASPTGDLMFEGEESITRVGTMLGTPAYISPEQALGDPVDLRTDVYSLGVVLFEMVTGRVPFTGKTVLEVLSQHVNSPPPTFADANTLAPYAPELERLVLKCLEKSADQRYASMSDVIHDLREVWTLETEMSYATEASMSLSLADLVDEAALLAVGQDAEPPSPSRTASDREDHFVAEEMVAPKRSNAAAILAGLAFIIALSAVLLVALGPSAPPTVDVALHQAAAPPAPVVATPKTATPKTATPKTATLKKATPAEASDEEMPRYKDNPYE